MRSHDRLGDAIGTAMALLQDRVDQLQDDLHAGQALVESLLAALDEARDRIALLEQDNADLRAEIDLVTDRERENHQR